MFYIQGREVKNPWNWLIEEGDFVSPRGLGTYEVLGLEYYGADLIMPTRTGVNSELAYVEGLNLIAGYTDLEALRAVAPKTTQHFYDANKMSWYAEDVQMYMERCLRRLIEDPFTRKAVAYIGEGRSPEEDATCVTTCQFLRRDEGLQTILTMRSWDMQLGVPYDIAMFALLSQAVRRCLGLDVGWITVKAGSAHIYLHSYKPYTWTYAPVQEVPHKVSTWSEAQAWAEAELRRIRTTGDKDA